MQPKTEHQGFEIIFDGHAETWKCNAMALENKSLTVLKKSIDTENKRRRRVDVPALHLTESFRTYVPTVKACRIVLLRTDDRHAEVKFDREKGQTYVDIGELFSLDQKPQIDEYIAAKKAANKAEANSKRKENRLKPMSAKIIREIVARSAEES